MLKRYKIKFYKDCTQILITAWGYDAINLLAKAIKSAGLNREKDTDELYKIQNYPGASGTISISPEGSSKTLETVFQIRNRRFVRVE